MLVSKICEVVSNTTNGDTTNEAWHNRMEKRTDKWARRAVRGVKGDKIFRGMISETEAYRYNRWDDILQEVVYGMDVENRFNNIVC